MSVAFESVVNVTPSTGTDTGASPSITTAAIDPVVVVCIDTKALSGETVTGLTITGFGGTAVPVVETDLAHIWAIKAPTPNTAGTVQANFSGSVPYQMAVLAYSGADQSDPCPSADTITHANSTTPAQTADDFVSANNTADDATVGCGANLNGQDWNPPGQNSRFVNNTTAVNMVVGDAFGTDPVQISTTGGLATDKVSTRIKAAGGTTAWDGAATLAGASTLSASGAIPAPPAEELMGQIWL